MTAGAELLVLSDYPPGHPVSLSLASHLLELGVDFTAEAGDTFPRRLPDTLDGYKAVLLDAPAFARLMRDAPARRRLERFAAAGGFVTALSELGVGDEPPLRIPLLTKLGIDLTISDRVHDVILHARLTRFSPAQAHKRGALTDAQVLATLKAFILDHIRSRRHWDEFTLHFWKPALALARAGHEDVRSEMVEAVRRSLPNLPTPNHHDVLAGFFAVPWLCDQTGDRQPLEPFRAALDEVIARRPREMGTVTGAGFVDDPLGARHRTPEPGMVGSIVRRRVIWAEVLHFHGPALASMTRATGQRKYLDEAMRLVEHVAAVHVRPDGLVAHCTRGGERVCAAWGRAQSHALYGLRYMLEELSPGSGQFKVVLELIARIGRGLRPHQDAGTGLWRNVIDHPDARLETSSTCGIACALGLCLREGWLSRDEFGPMVVRACQGLKRMFWRGGLAAGCRGTSAAEDVHYYLARPQGWSVVPQLAMALLDRGSIRG